MDKPSYKLVGAPCGHHGQYTFYKALRITGERDRIIAIGDFFFVKIWQDSELVSVGELQLLWTDRVSDQTLVSLRLYFLPENTPDGRAQHGEDEVLAINDKVVLRADDLLSWVCAGRSWSCGLRAVWRGACAPPARPAPSAPLHHTKMDFSDVDREKSAIEDDDSPGVVVFSYPRYCRYRALLARLEGIQADWLRDSLVAALGGYAAPTRNTRILYCKETFEYADLEGHEFVCNHLAPKLKGRPRGRRRRPPRSRSHSASSPSSDSDAQHSEPKALRRFSLRNGTSDKQSSEEENGKRMRRSASDQAFLQQLMLATGDTNAAYVKDLSLRALYEAVQAQGGYSSVVQRRLWRTIHPERPDRARNIYARHLLPYENHERNSLKNHTKINGIIDSDEKIDTIDVPDSPLRPEPDEKPITEKIVKEDLDVTSKPAEELNREFLESLPKEEKPVKITVKPVEKLLEQKPDICKLFEERSGLISELLVKHNLSNKVIEDLSRRQVSEGSSFFLSELIQRLSLMNIDTTWLRELTTQPDVTSHVSNPPAVNGHAPNGSSDQKTSRPVGRSSLRAVRVKPTRPALATGTPPIPPLRPDSASSSPPSAPPITNFGIHHPPPITTTHSDDEIVEVPYKPKTPEIIDLDEYPESPQAFKKKKLDILKERGLEVTAIPTPAWGTVPPSVPLNPLLTPTPMILNPAMQHQIMTQASLFQMYNIIPQNYSNGIQPPKVIQATSIYGSAGPEKTVYGNPKDPFMPPPHIVHGAPMKPQRTVTTQSQELRPQDILDLTCKTTTAPPQKPSVEIVKLPSHSPKTPHNLSSKNYTLVDGKAVVGSNLEITLVNPKNLTPSKNRMPQKRSSNGKFMSTKTPTPPKDLPKYPSTSPSIKKPPITIPNYQIRDDASPTSSTGSRDSQNSQNIMQNALKSQQMSQMADIQKTMSLPVMDPMYMSAFYNTLGQIDPRQLAVYRDFMTNQFRYTSLLGNVGTPTTKN